MRNSSRIIVAAICALFFVLPRNAICREKPNIVFILADDVGIEPLGCYGGTSFQTPNIDAIAASGMQFQHCYSMPVCHPTRVCLLTGRYPRHLGNPSWGTFPARLESQTFAHALKHAGYATAVAGKWQLTLLGKDLDHPRRLGFDEYCLFGWHEGGRYHDPLIWQNGTRLTEMENRYGPDVYVEFLTDFMSRHRETPFLAFYSMALCHDVTDDLDKPVAYVPRQDRYMNYGAMVTSMDACVGRIVKAIDKLGLRKKTLIVFTADNGTARRSIIRAKPSAENANKWTYLRDDVFCEIEGRRVAGGKGSLTDGGTHVPLLANWAGTISPGQTNEDLVDFSDFLPTFVELADAELPSELNSDGISFAPRLKGTGSLARKWAYAESKNHFWVRTQRWKLSSSGEFFDIKSDPTESQPLEDGSLSKMAIDTRRHLQKAIRNLESVVPPDRE